MRERCSENKSKRGQENVPASVVMRSDEQGQREGDRGGKSSRAWRTNGGTPPVLIPSRLASSVSS